ncbi:MAG: AI-2E family transporter [Eubacteriales bacterium]|nr:AI-2E family transporter [Eubacteriales bacterium]
MKIRKPNLKNGNAQGILRDAAPYCVAVLFYLILKHLYVLGDFVASVFTVILPVILGLVLAYIMDPPIRAVEKKLRKRGKSHPRGKAITIVVLIIVFSLLLLAAAVVPQFMNSIVQFSENSTAYHASLQHSVDSIFRKHVNLTNTFKLTDLIMEKINDMIQKNVVSKSEATGQGLAAFAVDFILAVYFLIDKDKIIGKSKRFFQLIMKDSVYPRFSAFLKRCDRIFIKYLICEFVDAAIVGVANAVFMLICRMKYVPLVSVVVGVTNLIPTFGPIIGAACGVFILLLTNPLHAILFLLFTGVLQGADGYVIKPKLYGDSLGIPGIWILIGVILGGRIFGTWGMLLAIPVVAILDIVIREALVPWLKNRKVFAKLESLDGAVSEGAAEGAPSEGTAASGASDTDKAEAETNQPSNEI